MHNHHIWLSISSHICQIFAKPCHSNYPFSIRLRLSAAFLFGFFTCPFYFSWVYIPDWFFNQNCFRCQLLLQFNSLRSYLELPWCHLPFCQLSVNRPFNKLYWKLDVTLMALGIKWPPMLLFYIFFFYNFMPFLP